MALYRRIISSFDEYFVPWFECNSSCEATPPPSVDIISISFANHNRYLANVVTIAISVITSLFFVSFVYFLCSRRRQRSRRPLLPHAVAASAASFPPSDEGEKLHPIWYVQTVGLDEAMIRSVAVAEYKAGNGLLGAMDCSVCLREFQDGELIRLLPASPFTFPASIPGSGPTTTAPYAGPTSSIRRRIPPALLLFLLAAPLPLQSRSRPRVPWPPRTIPMLESKHRRAITGGKTGKKRTEGWRPELELEF